MSAEFGSLQVDFLEIAPAIDQINYDTILPLQVSQRLSCFLSLQPPGTRLRIFVPNLHIVHGEPLGARRFGHCFGRSRGGWESWQRKGRTLSFLRRCSTPAQAFISIARWNIEFATSASLGVLSPFLRGFSMLFVDFSKEVPKR